MAKPIEEMRTFPSANDAVGRSDDLKSLEEKWRDNFNDIDRFQ